MEIWKIRTVARASHLTKVLSRSVISLCYYPNASPITPYTFNNVETYHRLKLGVNLIIENVDHHI